MRSNWHRVSAGVVFSLAALSAPLWAAESVEAVTRPSEDVTLSFVFPGRVRAVLVKAGDTVKAEQLLVQMDDAVERVRLEQLKAQVESDIEVRAGQATLNQRKVDLQKKENAFAKQVATKLEVEHARLDVTIAELSLELAKFKNVQARYQHEELKVQLERMTLKSPIAGMVEEVMVRKGESADKLQDVLRIVNVDPLWTDVPVPLVKGRRLRRGGSVTVRFAGEDKAVTGRIIHVSAEADAAADTLSVRVEIPNPTRRPAGELVSVRVDGALAARPVAGNMKPELGPAAEKTDKQVEPERKE